MAHRVAWRRQRTRGTRVSASEIDHSLARGLDDNDRGHEYRKRPSALSVIFYCKPLLTFTAAITLFHFADAAMLPLVGERLSQGQKDSGSHSQRPASSWRRPIPMAMLVGDKSDLGPQTTLSSRARYSAGRAIPGGWERPPLLIALSAGRRHIGCRRSLDIVFGEIDK